MAISKKTTAKTEVKVEEVKTAKVEKTSTPKQVIDYKTLSAKDITITHKTSCVIFQSANGIKWYLKGSTLEVTIPTAKERFIPYPKERLDSGRCGKIIGTIKKVNTNSDLENLLKSLASIPAPAPKKVEKVEEKADTKTAKK